MGKALDYNTFTEMNILIDCGANIGQGFERLKGLLNIDSTWQIIMFEPNPECIPFLRAKYKHEIINKAVSTDNESRRFNIQFCEKAKNWTGGASHFIDNSEYKKPRYIKTGHFKDGGMIECIDLSTFIATHCSVNDEVYLKLDIEGMEFPVLDKMIKDGTILLIDSIFVEWHQRLLKKRVSRFGYLDYFNEHNINYSEWVY